MTRILVTGGAGFIGSHIVDALVARNYRVRVFDNLDSQVHGVAQRPPAYLNPEAEFVAGDMRDREALSRALRGVDAVFHEAAAVGVGQSMYEIARYVEYNALGTANLLDVLVNDRNAVGKLIVASSMSIYGEGEYVCAHCGPAFPQLRPAAQMEAGQWEPCCPQCGAQLQPAPTGEGKPLAPTSVYAVTKRDQEELCLAVGRAYGIPTVALRYFNAYGPRQALSNPYTGVAAIFCARIANGRPPILFEDGWQSRDFTHVRDIAQANILALENPAADYEVFNVGTGVRTPLRDLARLLLARSDHPDLPLDVTRRFRAGDIRHCYADIGKIQRALGYYPQVPLREGIGDLVGWLGSQAGAADDTDTALEHLSRRGLIH